MQLSKNLTTEIQKRARKTTFDLAHYFGTAHHVYNVSMPDLRKLAASFKKQNSTLPFERYVNVLDRLFHASSFEEKVLGSLIFGAFPKLLSELPDKTIDAWLERLTGWAEVDIYSDEVDKWLSSNPQEGVALLKRWNKDSYLEKRRASLVVLCRTIRHDPDDQYVSLSFQCINTLKHEKHVMITKAISWILRAMITYHKDDVRSYLKENLATLPKIAIREVTRKLETGRK
ncbi:MAG TPA: DNA alkylation repair protein [Patescibacteria group bacterium]|nr:DNA alkylation repair protein [Patescibacteria group bacterium]